MVETAPKALWTSLPSWSASRIGREDFRGPAALKILVRVTWLEAEIAVGAPKACPACRRQPRVPQSSSRLMFFSLPLTHWSLTGGDDFHFLGSFAPWLQPTPCSIRLSCCIYPLDLFYVYYFNLCFLSILLLQIMFVEILYQIRTCPKVLRWLAALVLLLWFGAWHQPLYSKTQHDEIFTPLVRKHIDNGSGHGGSKSCHSRSACS